MAQVTHFMYGTSSTYRADAFTSASATNVKEGQITAAIAAAVLDGVQAVFVPQSMLPYNASLVSFNNAVQMLREGGNPAYYDVFAYGGAASDVYGSVTAAANAVTAAAIATSKTIQWGDGTLSLRPVISNAMLTFPYDVVGRGPGTIDSALAIFNGTPDPSIYIGYNLNGLGSLLVAGEPAAAWGIEGNYNDNSGQNKMEAYVQFMAADLSVQRPFFSSYNRVTKAANPYLYGDSIQLGRGNQTESIASFVNDGVNGNRLNIFPTTSANGSYLVINAKVGTNALIQFGITGTNLAQFQCSSATRMDILVNNRQTAYFYATPGGGVGDAFAVGVSDNGAVGTFNNSSNVNALLGVVARGNASQTGNLFEAQSSTPTTLWAITSAGNMKIGANQVVGARVTGYTAMTGTPDKATAYATGTITLAQLAGRVMQLQADLTTHGLIGA